MSEPTNFQRLELENDELKVSLSSFAGAIESLVDKRTGSEHFWRYDASVWPRRTPVCFPICGGLLDNEYVYRGKTYALPAHGFLREKNLRVLEHTGTKAVLELVSDEETKAAYPFDFRFTLIEELSGGSFIVRYLVENTGSGDMYFSVGSHSTYRVPIAGGETWNDYRYAFGAPQKAGRVTTEGGFVTGRTDDVFQGRDGFDLSGFFENGSTILDLREIDPKHISIESKKSGSFTKVAFEGFSYCVLWAPKGASPFACIEPWTGLPDRVGHDKDITKKLGIMKLARGAAHTCTQTLTVG